MSYSYETPYTNITERTSATLESSGMVFAGVTEDGAGDALRTDFDSIGDAIRARNILESDTTYYVAKTGNDTTGDGTSGLPWLTVEHAIDVVNSFVLLPGVVPTIQVGDGVYTLTSSIDTVPPGTVITGENTLTLAVTSVQSSSGTSGAYSIVLNADDVSDILITDECAITGAAGGTTPDFLAGTWDITNVDAVNSRITVTSTNNTGVPSGAVTAVLEVYKTVLAFSGVSGIVDAPIAVRGLALVGDNTSVTFGITSQQTLITASNISIRNFGTHGMSVQKTGTIFSDSGTIALSGNGLQGIYSDSTIALNNVVISGNGSYGMYCTNSGKISTEVSVISGNASGGIYCSVSATVYLATLRIYETVAAYAGNHGVINIISLLFLVGSTSPALNTQGNEFGYIDS